MLIKIRPYLCPTKSPPPIRLASLLLALTLLAPTLGRMTVLVHFGWERDALAQTVCVNREEVAEAPPRATALDTILRNAPRCLATCYLTDQLAQFDGEDAPAERNNAPGGEQLTAITARLSALPADPPPPKPPGTSALPAYVAPAYRSPNVAGLRRPPRMMG